MNEDVLEFHPNGELKHKIVFYPIGCKHYEQYYDEQGNFHRDYCLPDYESWYGNGYLYHQTFCIRDRDHNISNPADIWYNENGKIDDKYYYINGNWINNKLNWMNNIKNI